MSWLNRQNGCFYYGIHWGGHTLIYEANYFWLLLGTLPSESNVLVEFMYQLSGVANEQERQGTSQDPGAMRTTFSRGS